MATKEIPVLGGAGRPDETGDVFTIAVTTAHANFANRETQCIVFNDSAVDPIIWNFSFKVPADYVGSPRFRFWWTIPTGSGNVRWESRMTPLAPGEDMDIVPGNAVTPTAEAVPTAERWKETIHTLTAPFAAGDLVHCTFGRGTTGDTLAGIVIVDPDSAYFDYSDV